MVEPQVGRAEQFGVETSELPIPEVLSILPGDAAVLFPFAVLPLTVKGEKWTRLINEAVTGQRVLGYFLKREPQAQDPVGNIFEVGTAASIARLLRLPDGTVQVLLQGLDRIRLLQLTQTDPYPRGRVKVITEEVEPSPELEALRRTVLDMFQRAVTLSPALPEEMAAAASGLREPGRLADLVAAVLNIPQADKQGILETLDVQERLRTVSTFLQRELEVLEIGSRIQEQVKEQMDKTRREYYLREQLRAIQQELGETSEQESEAGEYRRRLEEANPPPEVHKEMEREMERFSRMPPGAPERSYIENYLDWMLSLPWSKSTEDALEIDKARQILDEDHYDIPRVKDRILEYLAVRKLSQRTKGPILSLIGPPGVGKTSLGQSIARAMGRKFMRVSLGGIRDEAEIRGHRRTYVGAMPGRIIQGIRRAGSNNPVFMLDEVDKLSAGIQGDPAAALLEVLDPAQNNAFVDLYLGVPFDLSKVLFITTGNMLETIPGPLRDRMEVITLAGYTEAEKLEIAKRYLVPKQVAENGLSPDRIRFLDDGLAVIISGYTREAGVRNLEREIGAVARKAARAFAEGSASEFSITADSIADYLGPRRYRQSLAGEVDEIGVATGMAWTPVGGEILMVEASLVPGRGNLILTGQLGDVMRESAMAALTYARSRAKALGAQPDFYEKNDVHIHVPAGAVPKDGPSAGITMATALISAVSRHPVSKDIAMTGEITLRGKVLPIGGVKEKVLAAHRAGIMKVILPGENERDLTDIPEDIKRDLQFVFVDHMDEVLNVALLRKQVEEKVDLAVGAGSS